MSEARREEAFLQRLNQRCDALMERVAHTIEEALHQYVDKRELEHPKRPRPPPTA